MARRVESAGVGGGPDPLESAQRADGFPILVVDDHAENLLALEAVLEPLELDIVTATSGEEALRLLLDRDFALILLDVRMPGLDGLETAELIKQRERTRDIPIVFLTAAREELEDIIRAYGLGAVDYILKPFDTELLRSKVAVFAELGRSRWLLKRSEAFLRGAFDAPPVGRTVLDAERRIVRSNPAFAAMLGYDQDELGGRSILELCGPEDRNTLTGLLEHASAQAQARGEEELLSVDLQLLDRDGRKVWVAPAAVPIEAAEHATQLLLIQWIDVTARRRAEAARAELLIEHAARVRAEAHAEHMAKLQQLVEPITGRSLQDALDELAERLVAILDADAAEIEVTEPSARMPTRCVGACARALVSADAWFELPLAMDSSTVAAARIALAGGRPPTAPERETLDEAGDRLSLLIRRAQLHDQERRIAVELQRGLLPSAPPELSGLEIAAHLEAAGLGAEVGGDWYDTFELAGQRLGVVIGDVTGNGIRAASAMGQLRSVTRAFAIGAPESLSPAAVLARVNQYHRTVGFEELCTLLYVILDPAEGILTWANAGHLPPLVRSGSGETRTLWGADSMLCRQDVTFEDRRDEIGVGDALILYTDGLVERRGESIADGVGRLVETLGDAPEDPSELCSHLFAVTRAAAQPEDDITAVVIRISAVGREPVPMQGLRSGEPDVLRDAHQLDHL